MMHQSNRIHQTSQFHSPPVDPMMHQSNQIHPPIQCIHQSQQHGFNRTQTNRLEDTPTIGRNSHIGVVLLTVIIRQRRRRKQRNEKIHLPSQCLHRSHQLPPPGRTKMKSQLIDLMMHQNRIRPPS